MRKIIHLDLDAFFCAVEELHDPSLHGKAFAVGGQPDERGVVASCSYAARRCGVHSAMPMGQALRLCPQLIVIHHRHGEYGKYSQKVMDRLFDLSPLVEQISIDEAFIDVSDVPEDPQEIARRLQAEIFRDLGLPCSLGVASNKLVAKIATDVGKAAKRSGVEPPMASPMAITVVPAGQEAAFLARLPCDALWGVGPKTAARLKELGIHTIGDIASWPPESLAERFGKLGGDLARRARGLDDSPVQVSHEVKSISQETTFSRDVSDPEALRKTLRSLAEQVGRQLRAEKLCAGTVKIKLRWPDFTTLTRQETLPQPTDLDEQIFDSAYKLFNKAWKPRQAVRLLGVGTSNLGPPARQIGLWDRDFEKDHRLQDTLDHLQGKYGHKVIRRGVKR